MGGNDNFDIFNFIAKELSYENLAYLHVMDGLDFGAHIFKHCNLFDMKK